VDHSFVTLRHGTRQSTLFPQGMQGLTEVIDIGIAMEG
jgi:hypothetical protein